MKLRYGKDKYYLAVPVLLLIIIGTSYAMTSNQTFQKSTFISASLLEFVPEECRVLETSNGVAAEVVFSRDRFGQITDKTNINLLATNVADGTSAEYRLTFQNIGEFNVAVAAWSLEIDGENNELADLILFSGIVKIKRFGEEYDDVLGTFNNVNIFALSNTLTNLLKYRKIEREEKIVLDLKQYFAGRPERFNRNAGLAYTLMPVFVQYDITAQVSE